MKKQEELKYIRKQKGFVPYKELFELYNDEDEIPKELIDLECRKENSRGIFMICSAQLAEQLNNIK